MHATADPGGLIGVGVVCTVTGLAAIRKALTGHALLPGTTWTRVPRWILWLVGLALQLPLPLALFFLRKQGLLW
jgi:hypothetical protein